MAKPAKRLMLDDIYAIDRNESWFSDMAKKGLHLKKFGRIFVYFEKGEPKETKYRIDYLKEKPSSEQLGVYQDCGWDIAANSGDFYVFSADALSGATELHTDPIEQGFTLSDLNKRLKFNLIIVSLAMALFFGIMFSIYFLNEEPFLFMIKGQFIQQMLLVIVELYVFYAVIRNYRSIRNLKKSLLQGEAINHKEGYRKARLTGGITACLFLFMAFLTILIPFFDLAKSKDYTLPEANTGLPAVRLADLEQNPEIMRQTGYNYRGEDDVDSLNRVRYEWSLLAPVQYEVCEHGTVENELWEDGSGKYSPSITTRFYKLTFGSMAENLTLDLIKRYVYSDNISTKEVDNRKFDKIYIAEDGIQKQVFAYWDNQVVHVTYYGKRKTEDIISVVSEKYR